MTDPKDIDHYNERAAAGSIVSGHGMDTKIEVPCPFCAAPGFLKWGITEMRDVASAGATCANCGRSSRLIFSESPARSGIGFEIVQTGGSDPPDYLPKMRRV